MSPIRLVAVGDPVMDVLAHVPALPPGTEAGGCLPVNGTDMASLLGALPAPPTSAPGGSAANVARGLAQLLPGGACAATFHGMIGNDVTGDAYTSALAAHGVKPALLVATGGDGATLPTAVCACLVTPDGQRTMRTCLGAATGLTNAEMLPAGWASGADAVHVEGYALWRPGFAEGLFACARAARGEGGEGGASTSTRATSSSTPHLPPPPLTSLDCASFEVVRAKAASLRSLLEAGAVDVLFANEEEAAALGRAWNDDDDGREAEAGCAASTSALNLEAAALAGQRLAVAHTPVATVVSLGPRGARALWWEDEEEEKEEAGSTATTTTGRRRTLRSHTAPAPCVAVKDTVGAGDAFAAGFLAGLLSGVGVEKALAAGCAAGGAAVVVDGADAGAGAMAAVGRKVLLAGVAV